MGVLCIAVSFWGDDRADGGTGAGVGNEGIDGYLGLNLPLSPRNIPFSVTIAFFGMKRSPNGVSSSSSLLRLITSTAL